MAFNHPPDFLLPAALQRSPNMRREILREAAAFRTMLGCRHVESHAQGAASMDTCPECYPLAHGGTTIGHGGSINAAVLSPGQRYWFGLIQSAQALLWSTSSLSAAIYTSVPTSGSDGGPLLDFVLSVQGEWRVAVAVMTEQRYEEAELGMGGLVGHQWQIGLASHVHGLGVSGWQGVLFDLGVWMATNDCRWVILGTQRLYRFVHLVYVPVPQPRSVGPRTRPHLVLSTTTPTNTPNTRYPQVEVSPNPQYPLVEVLAWLIATGPGPFTLAQLAGAFEA